MYSETRHISHWLLYPLDAATSGEGVGSQHVKLWNLELHSGFRWCWQGPKSLKLGLGEERGLEPRPSDAGCS